MSDEDRYRRRRALLIGDLLTVAGVVDLLDSYTGPPDPVLLAEAASVAGIRGLEATDFELLVTALPAQGEHISRWLGVEGSPP